MKGRQETEQTANRTALPSRSVSATGAPAQQLAEGAAAGVAAAGGQLRRSSHNGASFSGRLPDPHAETQLALSHARQLWRRLGREVMTALAVSRQFATLRDMQGGACIDPARLTTVGLLAEGAYASVEVCDLQAPDGSACRVAVKRLKPGLLADEAEVADFRREAQLLNKLHHRCIVEFIGTGHADVSSLQQPNPSANPDGNPCENPTANPSANPTPDIPEGTAISAGVNAGNIKYDTFSNGIGSSASSNPARGGNVSSQGGSSAATSTCSAASLTHSSFIVSEYMDGGSLKALVLRQMNAPDEVAYKYMDALRWALQVAQGLCYLHSANPLVIHRDLKLENVLLKGADPHTADAKLADFGLAAVVRARDTQPRQKRLRQQLREMSARQLLEMTPAIRSMSTSLEHKLSQPLTSPRLRSSTTGSLPGALSSTNSLRGTLSGIFRIGSSETLPPEQLYEMTGQTGSYLYMAPEVLRGQHYNEKVDVFSMAVIMYELFARSSTSALILKSGSHEECMVFAYKVVNGYRRPMPAGWPEELRRLIAACWAADPVKRPTMLEVAHRLLSLGASGVVEAMDQAAEAAAAEPAEHFCNGAPHAASGSKSGSRERAREGNCIIM